MLINVCWSSAYYVPTVLVVQRKISQTVLKQPVLLRNLKLSSCIQIRVHIT